MNCRVINDPAFCWERFGTDGIEIYSRGGFWSEGKYYAGSRACERVHALFSGVQTEQGPALPGTIRQILAGLDGLFAFIVQSRESTLACVDHVRSFPLFYVRSNEGLLLSWSAQALKSEVGLARLDETACLEFLMAGYVSGGNTLYSGLHQLQGGEFLFYTGEHREMAKERYCTFFSEDVLEGSEEDLLHEAGLRYERTFSRLVESLDGRQACIPLSAGLDSRLILGFLKEHRYDNIVTFTYGKKGLWEVKEAGAVAEKARVPWTYVEYKPDAVKDYLFSKQGRDYFRFACGLASVPLVTDRYALSVLGSEKRLDDECVILNGQTGDFITGGHMPGRILEGEGEEMGASSLLDYMAERHYSLWRNLKTERNLARLRQIHSDLMGLDSGATLPRGLIAKEYERFEWQERQCKYVVNGQRMYDWLGYDWQLPLWSMDLFTFWREVPWRHKVGQKLFKQYLQQCNPGGLFSIKSSERRSYIPGVFLVPQLLYQLLAKPFGLDTDWFKRKFVNYYWLLAPYYPQRSYLEYLKDSGNHRNNISYLGPYVLKLLEGKAVCTS